ncbi:MAG TPA: protease inhibitor I42 family protein [Methyloceanibacter sp.]|nr:protease inhibitor I42 family protein [Methyloceanibacter sp.]
MALGQETKEVVFEGEATSLSVSIAPGDVLHVKLAALPSAGFNWRLLSADPSVIVLEETRSEKSEGGTDRPPKIGGPASQLFIFKAHGEGETKAVFVYARPWEKDKPPARTATLNVKVGL